MAQCGYRAWQSRVVQPATVRQEGPVVERDVGITSQTIQIVRLVLTPERPTTYTGAATAKDGDPLLAGHEGSRKHGTQEGGVVQSNPKSASPQWPRPKKVRGHLNQVQQGACDGPCEEQNTPQQGGGEYRGLLLLQLLSGCKELQRRIGWYRSY